MTNRDLLDTVFGDPAVQHGLRLFGDKQIEALPLYQREGKVFVTCHATGKERVAKPEEVVRQLTLYWLVEDLGYPLTRISIEVPVKMGSTYASKAADIVVYTDEKKLTPHIILEVKKPKRKDGLDQLHSYMNATGVYFGAWLNGHDAIFQLRLEPNLFEGLVRLPSLDQTLEDIKTPLTKDDLVPIEDLREEVTYLEHTVLANAGVSAFEEIFRLIFTKLFDEFGKAGDEAMEFRITTAPPRDQYDRLNALYKRAAQEWPDIFSPNDDIDLTPQALVAVASALQAKRFFDADLDVVDAAFEYMINPEQKGDRGQFFTPRPVVKMCVRMMNPGLDEKVLDPACGPGGFLIHTLHWVFHHYLEPRFTTDLGKRKLDYATGKLFGIDFDVRLARVAKAMMLIAGDGRTNIFRVNTLDSREWADRSDGLASSIQDEAFDLVLTNPPFAGNVLQPEILGGFDLAYKGDPSANKRAARLSRDLLFIERNLRFLKPGGRLAIVLPQGTLNNVNSQFVRQWLLGRARVLAVVGLHSNTFKPFTNTKTSVLFLQRLAKDEEPSSDYEIFMAVNKKPVRDSGGDYVFARDPGGHFVRDDHGRRIVADDLEEIAERFEYFSRQQNLGFRREP
jgi:type I restriction enzyme M protein